MRRKSFIQQARVANFSLFFFMFLSVDKSYVMPKFKTEKKLITENKEKKKVKKLGPRGTSLFFFRFNYSVLLVRERTCEFFY